MRRNIGPISTLVFSTAFLALIGCEFDVPITAEPSRSVEPALLGDWIGDEWNENDCKDRLKVRKLDDSTYILSLNEELHTAYHSDIGKVPFVTVLNVESSKRTYSFFTWSLSDGGKRLTLRLVTEKLIPREVRDSAAVVKLLQENLGNPQLFDEPIHFTRKTKASRN